MSRGTRFLSSTLGTKVVVAVTGIILLGFVLLHMLGNLKTFTGIDADGVPHIDIYAHFLRTMGEPMIPHEFALWATRVILLADYVRSPRRLRGRGRQDVRRGRDPEWIGLESLRMRSVWARIPMVRRRRHGRLRLVTPFHLRRGASLDHDLHTGSPLHRRTELHGL